MILNSRHFICFLVLLYPMNGNVLNKTEWKENVILVDADYVDKVAFDLIVNFERMIGRRIPQADMAKWLECIALDGGMKFPTTSTQPTEPVQQTQVILLHQKQQMDNFQPSALADVDGKAFSGPLGEFLISCVPVEEMVTAEDLFIDSMQIICNSGDVKRVMVIPDADHIYNKVRAGLRHADDNKHITVFSMQPMEGGNYRQEILGYSLMAALGIRAEEIKN